MINHIKIYMATDNSLVEMQKLSERKYLIVIVFYSYRIYKTCSERLNNLFIFQERNLFDFYMQLSKTEVTTTRSTLYSYTLLYAIKPLLPPAVISKYSE